MVAGSAVAEKIIPPSNLFRDPQFVRDFVGSYGFHSEVEPKVSPEESRILVKLRELFEKSRFSEAESELVAGFMVEYSSTPYLLYMLGE